MRNFIMRSGRGLLIKATVLFCILLVAGCSLVRMGYNNGELLSYWWLNGYVDVSAEQKPWIKQRIADLFIWHRKTQLKDYVQLLAVLQKQVQRSTNKAEILTDYDEFKKRAMLMINKALPALADLALSLQSYQIAHIEKKFSSSNDTYRKEYLHGSLEERQLFRYKKAMEQAEYWFGGFSREQQTLIRRVSDDRPLNYELWLSERLRQQQGLVAVLKKIQAEKPNRDAAIQLLKSYSDTIFERIGGGEHDAFFNASKDGMAGLAVAIINCTTPAQKARAIKKLQQWIDNFNDLSG